MRACVTFVECPKCGDSGSMRRASVKEVPPGCDAYCRVAKKSGLARGRRPPTIGISNSLCDTRRTPGIEQVVRKLLRNSLPRLAPGSMPGKKPQKKPQKCHP